MRGASSNGRPYRDVAYLLISAPLGWRPSDDTVNRGDLFLKVEKERDRTNFCDELLNNIRLLRLVIHDLLQRQREQFLPYSPVLS